MPNIVIVAHRMPKERRLPSALIADGVSRSSSQTPRITASVTKGATIARCHVNRSLFGSTPISTGRRA